MLYALTAVVCLFVGAGAGYLIGETRTLRKVRRMPL